MKTIKKTSLLVVPALALLGLLVVVSGNGETRVRAERVRDGAARAEGPREASADAVSAEVVTLRFESARRMRIEGNKPVANGRRLPPLVMEFGLRARIDLTVYSDQLWGLRAGDFELSVRANGKPQQQKGDLAREMKAEVLVRRDEQGRFVEVVHPAATGGGARKTWQHILECLQMTGSDRAEWQAEERDSTGAYTARYRRVSEPGAMPIEIVREKGSYTKVTLKGNAKITPEARAESKTRYLLDPLPLRIEGEEKLHITLGRDGQRADGRARFVFERISRTQRETLTPVVRSDREAPVAAKVNPAVAEHQVRTLIGALEAIERAGKLRSDETFHALTALVELLKKSDAAVFAARTGYGAAPASIAAALGAADTPASRAALRSILDQRAQPMTHRRSALFAVVRLANPEPEFDESLRRLRAEDPELADSALLMLASVGRKAGANDPRRFAKIESEVLAELNRAETVQQLTTALEALGNLGPRQVPERAKQELASTNPMVRAAAIRSLKRVRTNEVRAMLETILRDDRAAHVRRAALETLANRSKHGLDRADLRPILTDVAENDATRENRDRARKLLG